MGVSRHDLKEVGVERGDLLAEPCFFMTMSFQYFQDIGFSFSFLPKNYSVFLG